MSNSYLHINKKIRAKKVLLIDSNGKKLGIKNKYDALKIAIEQNMDLVQVAASENPPVCKIMDYNKHKYNLAKLEKKAKRNKQPTDIKEIKYGVKIGQRDKELKTSKIIEFLNKGYKTKVTVIFRGMEIKHPEIGERIIEYIKNEISEVGKVESGGRLKGKNIIMMLSPKN